MNISETPVSDEMTASIQGCAADAAGLLQVDPEAPAEEILKRVDEFIHRCQKSEPADEVDKQDLPLLMGSLWGQQLVRKLGWQWAGVTFHDNDDAKAIGVFSPDRSLAIYPFHFVYGCLENNAPVTILLAFNMLVDGDSIPTLPPDSYENVMDNVHHIIPRD